MARPPWVIHVVAGGGAFNIDSQLNKLGFYLVLGICVLVIYGLCIYYAIRMLLVGALRCDYYLGFLRERTVSEELNQMMARGYRVFHNIQFEGRPGSKGFNIDHMAVGPGGIFSVETKPVVLGINRNAISTINVRNACEHQRKKHINCPYPIQWHYKSWTK